MGRSLGASKDIEKFIRAARKQWGENSVKVTGGNHLKFIPPEGPIIFGGLTACGPGQKKMMAQLRKAGLKA